ncbi:hypothetical protein IAU59_003517 [Kwoniella sp. CBS 9459]
MSKSDSTTPIHHPLAAIATPLSPAETQPGTPTTEPCTSPNVPLIPASSSLHASQQGSAGPSGHTETKENGKFSVIRSGNAPGHGGRAGLGTAPEDHTLTGAGGAGAGPSGFQDWEEGYQRQKLKGWEDKVKEDLEGWRGGRGTPRSAYPRQALPPKSYFNQPITGTIGRHLPKEIVRIERDWSGGEVCQFESTFPLELEGRIQPSQFTAFINHLNEILTAAYSVRGAIWDNLIAVSSLWTSLMWRQSHFERELKRAESYIHENNKDMFNPHGLNVLTPRHVALQFLEIEYVSLLHPFT